MRPALPPLPLPQPLLLSPRYVFRNIMINVMFLDEEEKEEEDEEGECEEEGEEEKEKEGLG